MFIFRYRQQQRQQQRQRGRGRQKRSRHRRRVEGGHGEAGQDYAGTEEDKKSVSSSQETGFCGSGVNFINILRALFRVKVPQPVKAIKA